MSAGDKIGKKLTRVLPGVWTTCISCTCIWQYLYFADNICFVLVGHTREVVFTCERYIDGHKATQFLGGQ